MPIKSPPFKRLYENMTVLDSGCWIWNGATGSSGYGQIKTFGKYSGTHRLSYELHNGAIPDGLEVMHSCDNRRCINPEHLNIGTHLENMRDMIVKGRKVVGSPNPRKGDKNSQSIPVLVLGKAYGSFKEAERELGYSSGSVKYWIKNKPSKARILTTQEYGEMKNGIIKQM